MILLQAHEERFNKQGAQQAGDVIFRKKPSQKYLFNFLCGISEKGNGVVSISFQSIATHMSKRLGKSMTIQAVSQLVKKLVSQHVLDYSTIKEDGGCYCVGTFRIAPADTLFAIAAQVKRVLEDKITAAQQRIDEMRQEYVVCKEDAQEGKAAIEEKKAQVKEKSTPKPFIKPIKKSDKTHLPNWASSDYSYSPTPMSPDKLAELEACIAGLRA